VPERFTTPFVRAFFNQRGYALPADFLYHNKDSPIPYTHTVCGYQGTVRFGNFLRHPETCLRCNNKERITTEFIVAIYARDGLIVKPRWKYTHKEDKVPYTCSTCGMEHSTAWNDFRNGHGCPSPGCCGDKGCRKPTIKWLAAQFEQEGYILRTKEYINARSPLVFWCTRCETDRTTTWLAFRQGQGCAKCGYVRRDVKRRAEGDLRRLQLRTVPRSKKRG
jgi:hypothetical protein